MMHNRTESRSTKSPSRPSSTEKEKPKEVQDALADMAAMIQQGNAEKIVHHCKQLASLLEEVSSSQIRNVFGPVKRMQLEWTSKIDDEKAQDIYRRLVLLRPKLEYMVAKASSKGSKKAVRHFQEVIDAAIQKVEEGQGFRERRLYFENFVAFFESLVAYHKQHEKTQTS